MRQYDTEAAKTNANNSAQKENGKPEPITQAELSRIRGVAQSNPSDQGAQLKLAKSLAEAAKVLSDEGGKADPMTKNRNRERYNSEAQKIARQLSDAGYPDGQFYLADSISSSAIGLSFDAREAFTLYQTAAKANHAQAAYRTAVCCEIGAEEGGGTRRDLSRAIQWYQRAANLGDAPAMFKLGMISLRGLLEQPKNPKEAIDWLNKACDHADTANPHALHEMAILYEGIETPGLVPRDESRALQLFTQGGKLGYKHSQCKLGQAWEYGSLGCPIEARNSIVWYTRAAAQGEHNSELALSGWYLTGSEGILEQSDVEAYLWAKKAADARLPKALFALGYFTEVGIGCQRSLEEAKKWYGKAAGEFCFLKRAFFSFIVFLRGLCRPTIHRPIWLTSLPAEQVRDFPKPSSGWTSSTGVGRARSGNSARG